MKENPSQRLEDARTETSPYISEIRAMWGLFEIRGPSMYKLRILSSGESRNQTERDSWEHVSVSVIGKEFCPTWEEMCFVKDLFWNEEEVVIQFHPAKSDYVNTHGFTLHLWKPSYDIPTPPASTVGIPGLNRLDLH